MNCLRNRRALPHRNAEGARFRGRLGAEVQRQLLQSGCDSFAVVYPCRGVSIAGTKPFGVTTFTGCAS